ncbi:hypothetical protein ABZ805_16280 [Saccharopolyspora sp. NPDC047091]|uniref:hypothetical protein n=1 Tax=Saccharopolyspora sp. NPDC047091 TaxID=3155924 RepID=UPI00340A0779
MDLGGTGAAVVTPPLVAGLLDDAAMFPPGLLPLPQAVRAHAAHRTAAHSAAVGPLVVAAPALAELREVDAGRVETSRAVPDRGAPGRADAGRAAPDGPAPLAVTVPAGPAAVPAALAELGGFPLRALEIPVPDLDPADLPDALRRVRENTDAEVYVEVPRDDRRAAVLALLGPLGCRAKFRTGGVRADLHPGEAELAAAVHEVVRLDVPFKATAGLHHAVRNSDGFEQHGFLNILLAVDAALRGGAVADLAAVLADRDAPGIAARVAALGEERTRELRTRFTSFGTCSVAEPLAELAALGLLPGHLATDLPAIHPGADS